MASWWKLIAEELAVAGGQGSHAKRVARHLGALDQSGSAAKCIALQRETTLGSGDWKRRIAYDTERVFGASGRRIYAALLAAVLPPGDDLADDKDHFDVLPYSVEVEGGTKLAGSKRPGTIAKFIHDIFDAQVPAPGTIYSMRYSTDFTAMTAYGVSAMFGFLFKRGNDFHLIGLRGDGGMGLHAYEASGDGCWNKPDGFTLVDGGPAAHGSQVGPNWIQIEIAADASAVTFRTSADGVAWTDEFTGATFPPPTTGSVTAWGPGAFFDADDDGPYAILVDTWTWRASTD